MKINRVNLEISAVRRSQYPTDNKPEFLLVGRSNVGKSSFINTLIHRKNYARTSSQPGKTQTINFYLVNDEFYLVDAPGYGFANVSKPMRKKFGLMMEDYLINRPNLKNVFMLIDFRHKPTSDDLMMYQFLKYYDIDLASTMAFGDGGNDIPMLQHVAISVAMNNASDEVKSVVDYITDDVDHDGIYKACLHYHLLEK